EKAPDKAAVDSAVEYLTEKLKETSAMKLKVTPKGRTPVHWWSPQLASFRNRCKALWRRAVRAGSAAEKEKRHIFMRERAQYRRALLAAKRESWRGYCKNAGKVGPWTVPYQIGAGKFRKPQVLGAVKDQNGHLTKDMASTIYAITDAIFPRDDPHSDSAVHCAHRRLVNPCADRDFTACEISGVVKSLAHRKAPGLDGISMELIRAIHCHEPKLLCFLFNAASFASFLGSSLSAAARCWPVTGPTYLTVDVTYGPCRKHSLPPPPPERSRIDDVTSHPTFAEHLSKCRPTSGNAPKPQVSAPQSKDTRPTQNTIGRSTLKKDFKVDKQKHILFWKLTRGGILPKVDDPFRAKAIEDGREDQVLVENSDFEVPKTNLEELAAKRDAAQKSEKSEAAFLQ
ncbi:hypothetical protein JTE90_025661, partial [Oedothorax gibbosus]